jgi:hypothetical protein
VFTVLKAGFPDAVVWNPWIAKAAGMADFGDEEYKVRCHFDRFRGPTAAEPLPFCPAQTWCPRPTCLVVVLPVCHLVPPCPGLVCYESVTPWPLARTWCCGVDLQYAAMVHCLPLLLQQGRRCGARALLGWPYSTHRDGVLHSGSCMLELVPGIKALEVCPLKDGNKVPSMWQQHLHFRRSVRPGACTRGGRARCLPSQQGAALSASSHVGGDTQAWTVLVVKSSGAPCWQQVAVRWMYAALCTATLCDTRCKAFSCCWATAQGSPHAPDALRLDLAYHRHCQRGGGVITPGFIWELRQPAACCMRA